MMWERGWETMEPIRPGEAPATEDIRSAPLLQRKPQRILYVDSDPGIGGGLISLRWLLTALDRTRYDPIVAQYGSHGTAAGIEALASEVIRLRVHDERGRTGRRVFDGLREAPLAGALRSRPLVHRLYKSIGGWADILLKTLPLAWELRSIIRSRHVALVHINNSVQFDRSGILAAWLTGTPCVCHVRNFERPTAQTVWFVSRVRAFIFASQALADGALGSLVEPWRRRVIPNAVDLAAYDPAADRAGARRALRLPADRPLVGAVGRLERWKGQDVFLRAVAEARRHIPDLQGLVVGAPEPTIPDSPAYAEELRALAMSLGLADCVRFTGFLEDMPAIMAALDVIVHCSVEPEPFGRVIIEGLAAGRPVVASAAGGALEIVADGVTGVLVAPGDPQALASALVDLLQDRQRAAQLAMAGRAEAVRRFGLQEHARQVEHIYEQVLAEYPQRA